MEVINTYITFKSDHIGWSGKMTKYYELKNGNWYREVTSTCGDVSCFEMSSSEIKSINELLKNK